MPKAAVPAGPNPPRNCRGARRWCDGGQGVTTKARRDEGTRRVFFAVRAFVLGQAGFFALLLLCVLLIPRGLWANHGYSYYGEQAATVLPYRLSFLITGVFTGLAAWLLPDEMPFRVIKAAFWLMLPCLIGLVLTTSSASHFISLLHVRIGTVLFVLQFALAAWLALIVVRDRMTLAWFLAHFLGGVVTLLALNVVIPWLIEGQIVFQAAFGVVVWRGLKRLGPR